MRMMKLANIFLAFFVTAYIAYGVEVTASSGQDDYAPGNAVDGNMTTRWGSHFTDHEWWQIKFDKVRRLAGMRIMWETAYAEKYEIAVSDDGHIWRTVYAEQEGDGGTDIIYFAPVDARYLRIVGIQRGTGWGYSIWEIEFIDAKDMPEVIASSGTNSAGAVVNGDFYSAWHSAGDGEQSIEVHFKHKIKTGGVELYWLQNYAVSYVVEGYENGKWKLLYKNENGNGGKDYIYFNAITTDAIRIRCLKSSSGNGYELAAIVPKSGDEHATPLRQYIALARNTERGKFPMWLNRQQEFWTVTGVPYDDAESLLGETGTFEPVKDGFSVMPFIKDGDRLITWDNVNISQSLAEDSLPLPSVLWDYGTWTLEITTVTYGDVGKSITAVRYRVHNRSPEKFTGKLVLAIRPVQLNPVWQFGGMSPIKKLECVAGSNSLSVAVNGRQSMILPENPEEFAAVPYSKGDIISYIVKGKLPATVSAQDKEGRTSAGFVFSFNLKENENKDFIAVFPLHKDAEITEWKNPEKKFRNVRQQQIDYWHNMLNRFRITIPEQRMINVLKSNLAYILINQDGPWIKPGSRNYNRSWIRDGAMTSVALLRMGIIEPVEKFLKSYIPLVDSRGWVPWVVTDGKPLDFVSDSREGQEYDSQGEFVFLLRQYLDFTGDKSVLTNGYPAVVRAMKFANKLRRERMTDLYKTKKPEYYGILPESNSHEGYYPAMHSYWDDFWYIRGLKDAVYLARMEKDDKELNWLQNEESDFRKDMYNSIMKVIKRDDLSTIPGCVEKGDFDPTSTAIAIMACDEGDNLPQPYMNNSFDKYYEEFLHRLRPGGAVSFTPYEVRTADAFIRMDKRERALVMLREFTTHSTRPYAWNEMAEVVHGRYRTPSYIGDMPHTWVGSGYVSAVRSIFAYEDADKLIIVAGIPVDWLRKGVNIKNLPTQFGLLNYYSENKGDNLIIKVSGTANPPGGIVVKLPATLSGKVLFDDGKEKELQKGTVILEHLPAEIVINADALAQL